MFRSKPGATALVVASLAAVAAVLPRAARADYLVIWSQEDFAPTNMSTLPLCVGDMIGNGQKVIVGRKGGNSTEIRDAMTGALILTFPAYSVYGDSYAMVDLDDDATPECVVTNGSATYVIDWVLVAGQAETGRAVPDFGLDLRPNPSRPGAAVELRIPERGVVEVSVYDVAGRRVRSLFEGMRDAGAHELSWDGRDDSGRAVAAGAYFVELRIDGQQRATRKSVLLQ